MYYTFLAAQGARTNETDGEAEQNRRPTAGRSYEAHSSIQVVSKYTNQNASTVSADWKGEVDAVAVPQPLSVPFTPVIVA